MKTRRIILHKDQLLYDIEALAYKFSEATGLEGKAKNSIAADHNETLDGRMLNRMMDLRNAQLKSSLQFALAKTEQGVHCNNPGEEDEYVYDLTISDAINDSMIDVAKTYMHDYVVRGVLLDWYKRNGVQTIAVDAGEVLELEESIVGILRGPSSMKKPLQPFGPRK